jgi:serine protease Do
MGRSVSSRIDRSLVAVLAGIVLMTAAMCGAQTGSLSADARRDLEVRPGVVLVYIELIGSSLGVGCKTGASGTGFLYRPDGYLITNGHVAQLANTKDREALQAQRAAVFQGCMQDEFERRLKRHITKPEAYQILGDLKVQSSLTVILDNHNHFEGEIKAYSDPITSGGKDVAIIKIDGNNLPTVPLGDSNNLNVNDHVYVIGYPGLAKISNASLLVATTSDGIISAVKNMDYTGTPLIQTNANINHGNSGGPGFDGAGHVIGIATFGKEGPGYNFLVPISTAYEFVRQAGAEPQRGNFDKTWHDALDAYSNQKWTKAHTLLNDVLEMMPDQPEAQKLQLLAAANARVEGPLQRMEETVSAPAIAGIVAFIVVAGALLVWLLVRKSTIPVPVAQPLRVAPPVPIKFQATGAATILSPPPQTSRVGDATPKPIVPPAPVPVLPAVPETFGTLHVSGGPLTGNRFPIPKAGLLIGRDPTKCAVVLPDDSISKEHAWVVPMDNGVAVIDRNSANGTYVNSVDSPPINKVVLRHGDRVYLGKKNGTVFTYYGT